MVIKRLYPDIYVSSIYHLPIKEFKNKNIKALFFDIDNTILPYHLADVDEKITAHFNALKEMGFSICLISNNTKKRIEYFAEKLDVMAIHFALKPATVKLKRALKQMKIKNKQAALIGDQIFTDVWCGNRAGLYTVLVEPVSTKDQWPTKVKRGLEKRIIRIYLDSIKQGGK